MYRALMTLPMMLVASSVMADNPMPPVPDGGLMHLHESACTDVETGTEGYCYVSTDREGNVYILIVANGEPRFIRQVVGDSYIVVWSSLGELM